MADPPRSERPDFREETLHLLNGLSLDRLRDRKSLLNVVDRQRQALVKGGQQLSGQYEAAFNLLTSGRLTQAFDLNREPTAMRDRYGRHMFGQSLLLARRLVEAGVPIVQCNMGIVQTWDNHADIFNVLQNRLLPPFDQGVAALVDDLEARGLLKQTLVVCSPNSAAHRSSRSCRDKRSRAAITGRTYSRPRLPERASAVAR